MQATSHSLIKNVLSSPGKPLDAETRSFLEPRFGTEFAGVRIYTGEKVNNAAESLSARAYTLGSDIAFAAGEYAPTTTKGLRLLAHELVHVMQQTAGDAGNVVRRDPKSGDARPATVKEPEHKRPPDKIIFEPKDLLVYPLIVDLWNDIFEQRLSGAEKEELKLTHKEFGAFWNMIFAVPFTGMSSDDNASFGDSLEAWSKYAEEIHRIAGGDDLYLDMLSSFVGINIDSYFSSDLFESRLKNHAASLVTVIGIAQGVLSIVQAVKEPGAEVGELEPSQWEKQTALAKALFNTIFKEQIKAPDFFNIGPLKLGTHPAFAAASPTSGGGPSELTFEHGVGQGEGQGGEQLKLALALNLPQVINMFEKEGPSASDLADLQQHRWQGSVWGSFQRIDPTLLQRAAGTRPSQAFNVGTFFGGGGFLGQLEIGGRYGGDQAEALTAWFLRGGFGYSGAKGAVIRKIGFDAVYTDWTEMDVFAPTMETGNMPTGGRAAQIMPFTQLEFGSARHRFGVGVALGFVTGTHEGFGISDMRGDFSYTYLGNRSTDQLPVFKLDLSSSVSRLDWFAPDSPLMTGVLARTSIDQYFVAGQVNTGAGAIPESRAKLIGDTGKVKVPTAVLFTGGVYF